MNNNEWEFRVMGRGEGRHIHASHSVVQQLWGERFRFGLARNQAQLKVRHVARPAASGGEFSAWEGEPWGLWG